MINGWYDLFSGAHDMFLWYANLTVPKRLLVRPADHSEVEKDQFDLDYGAEAHRWFDYWLKGIDNGIMKEPSIYYYVMGASEKDAWQAIHRWPLEHQKLTRVLFRRGEDRQRRLRQRRVPEKGTVGTRGCRRCLHRGLLHHKRQVLTLVCCELASKVPRYADQ